MISTRRPGATASSCRLRSVVFSHTRSARSDASSEAPPRDVRGSASGSDPPADPDAARAVAASAPRNAASAASDAVADPPLRSLAVRRSKGGTHSRSARSSSCAGVVGSARFRRSSSRTAARAEATVSAASAARAARSAASSRKRGAPAFSPRSTRSKNRRTSSPVGGSHSILYARRDGFSGAVSGSPSPPPRAKSPLAASPTRPDRAVSAPRPSARAAAVSSADSFSFSAVPRSLSRLASSSSFAFRFFFASLRDSASTPSFTTHSSILASMTARNAAGSRTAKERSSSSAFVANIPICSAK